MPVKSSSGVTNVLTLKLLLKIKCYPQSFSTFSEGLKVKKPLVNFSPTYHFLKLPLKIKCYPYLLSSNVTPFYGSFGGRILFSGSFGWRGIFKKEVIKVQVQKVVKTLPKRHFLKHPPRKCQKWSKNIKNRQKSSKSTKNVQKRQKPPKSSKPPK